MPVLDFTDAFRSTRANWGLRGKAFERQFEAIDARVPLSRRGVYLLLVTNEFENAIYDRNGAGKVIVPGSRSALKFGMYWGGIAARELQNHDHYHRRDPSGLVTDAGIFSDTVRLLLVLDLKRDEPASGPPSVAPPLDIRECERNLGGRVLKLLNRTGRDDPKQPRRSESRWIRAGVANPTKVELEAVLVEVARDCDTYNRG